MRYYPESSLKNIDLNGLPYIDIPDDHGDLKDADKLLLRVDYGCCHDCGGRAVKDCGGCSIRVLMNEIRDTCTVVKATDGEIKRRASLL